MVGGGAGVIGGYSAAIAALAFGNTSVLFIGGASLFGMASIIVTIPAIIGTLAYGIYKFTKTKKLKEFMNKLSDQYDNTMNEERKIFSLLLEETKNFFQTQLKEVFLSKAKDIIIKKTKDIIDKINSSRKEYKKNNLKSDLKELRMEISCIINENTEFIG